VFAFTPKVGGPAHHCDFYLTGCHKWLRAHLPMGLAFCPRRRSQDSIAQIQRDMVHTCELDDPLLAFTGQIEHGLQQSFTETVNLISLFSCRAAVSCQLKQPHPIEHGLSSCQANADLVCRATRGTDWTPLLPAESFRSAILLFRANPLGVRALRAERVREFFDRRQIALTSYRGGIIRLSMPGQPLTALHVAHLRSVLHKIPESAETTPAINLRNSTAISKRSPAQALMLQ